MATTIQSGRSSSPLLTADVASRAEVYGGRGLVFDGVSDYLEFDQINQEASPNYTLSFWANITQTPSGGYEAMIFGGGGSDYQGIAFTTSNKLYIRLRGSGWAIDDATIVTNVSTGTWNHYVIAISSSNYSVYLNGIQIHSTNVTLTSMSTSHGFKYIGKGASGFYNGKLSDLKFFNGIVATEAQAQELYLKPESMPSALKDYCVLWYPMSEANPESPQSIVYDHSEKKLDLNILANGTFDTDINGWANSSPDTSSPTDFRTITHATIDGRTCIDINDQSVGSGANRMSANYDIGSSLLKTNTLYKISYYARKSQSDSTNKEYAVALGHQYIGITAGTVFKSVSEWDTWEYHELYIISSTSNYKVHFLNTAFNNGIYNEHKGRLFLDDVKVQKVLMGNHATTNFFEPNLSSVLTSTQKTSFGDLLTSDDSSFDFTNGTVPVEDIVLGSELMNYNFADGTGVTVPSSLSSLTTFDGEMVINGGSVSSDYYTIADSTTWDVNKIYKIVVVCSAYTSGSISHQGGSASFGINFGVTTGETGTFTYYAVPSKDSSIGLRSQSFVGTISSISIKEATTPKFFPLVGSTDVTGHALKLINDGTNMGHIVLPITTVIGYQYYAELKVTTRNMSGGLSISDDLEENTLTVASTSGEVIKTPNFTASRTISYIHIKNNATNSNQYNLYDNLSTYLVGVSSTGLTTAQNEPVIPQVPLMKYNQKIFFSGNNGSGAEVLWNNIGGAFASSEFTLSVVHLGRDSDDIYTIFDITESPYTDFLRLFRDASGRYYVYIENANDSKTIYQYSPYADNADFHHIVLTCDGSKWCFYINGYKEREESNTHTTEHLASSTTDMRLGMIGTDTESYRAVGIIDELSLWNTVLTYDEVKELFADSAVKDATTHSKSGNLLGYWRNDGVTTWQDRKKEQWMMLNGTNTEIELSTSTQSSSIRTAIAWVYTDSSSLMSIFSGSNANIDNDLTSGFTRWYTGTSGWLQGTIDVRGAWTMVTYQFEPNGSNMDFKTYVNDTLDINLTLTSNYNNGTIRRLGYKSGQSRFFDGVIAQAGSVASALTQAQITEIFNLGRKGNWITTGHDWEFYYNGSNYATGTDGIEDASTSTTRDATITNGGISGGNDGSVQGTPDSITIREGLNSGKDGLGFPLKNPSSNVLRLNGSSEYVQISDNKVLSFGDSSGDLPFSIEAWIKMEDATNFTIVSKGIYNTSAEYIFWVNGSDKLSFELYDESVSNTYELAYYNTALTSYEGSWVHICGTYDGRGGTSANAGIKLYLNGENVSTTLAGAGTYVAMENLTSNVWVGRYDTNYADGLIDECRIYNKELSLAEIQKNHKHQKGKHKND